MKLMLIFPRMKYKTGDPPLGVCSIAAYVKKHSDAKVVILDTTFHPTFAYIEKNLDALKPDLVGIYTDTLMFNDFVKVAALAKSKGMFTFAGGPHPTMMPDSVKPHCDMIIPGEAETKIVDLIEHFKKKDFQNVKGIMFRKGDKWVKTPDANYIENLDTLEYPALEMVEMDYYLDHWHILDSIDPGLKGTNIMASRGCPYNCSFCQPNLRELFGSKVRQRSPEHVIGELTELKRKFNIQAFFLHDDTFNINKQWVKKFCELLLEKKINLLWACNSRINTLKDLEEIRLMHKAGLRHVHIGVESGSQRILNDIYRKGIKIQDVPEVINNLNKIGVSSLCFFMLGAPGETEKEIKNSIKFAISLNATEITATITSPLPGTKLWDMMQGKYKISTDFSKFDYYKERAFEDKDLPLKKLKRYQRILLIKFYIHPKRWRYIFNHFTSLKGMKKMWLKVKRFF